ncbi:hypothetical protein WR25_03180 [Diploscapter pachys]|uniref:Uncharacterized protein n=1 Tax=Diploscapter pachys TaxID=2018661 RepID=A0A2A2L886_9BILA|nr:hypothetical protein WR25_03180 [Diploscapter pachys]
MVLRVLLPLFHPPASTMYSSNAQAAKPAVGSAILPSTIHLFAASSYRSNSASYSRPLYPPNTAILLADFSKLDPEKK